MHALLHNLWWIYWLVSRLLNDIDLSFGALALGLAHIPPPTTCVSCPVCSLGLLAKELSIGLHLNSARLAKQRLEGHEL